jgi:GYF domain 2
MAEESWYYADAEEQKGPVSRARLQEMLAAGDLAPTSLVWQPGQEGWVEARAIPGLVTGAPPGVPPVPAGAGGRELLRSAVDGARKLHAGASRLPHLRWVDHLLAAMRGQVTTERLNALDEQAKRVGHLAYLAAAILLLVFFCTLSIQNDSIRSFLGALLIIVPVAVLAQYVGSRFLDAGRRLIDGAPSEVASRTFLTCYGLLATVGALVGLIDGIRQLFESATRVEGGIAIGLSLLLLYAAGASLNPSSLNVTVRSEASAGEEAIGVLMFLVKLPLRLVPFMFGVGSLVGLGLALYFVFHLASDDLPFIAIQATTLTPGILGVALLPLASYLGFLFVYLLIAVLSAILQVPLKLDALKADGR